MSSGAAKGSRRLQGKRLIVIGAGMAGLSAGQAAQRAGARVTVLEARDRIGGRIWTDRSMGAPVDLGASWIHKPKGNPLSKLAAAVNAPMHQTGWSHVVGYDADGARIDHKSFWKAISRVDHVNETIEDAADRNQSMLGALLDHGPDTLADPLMRAIQSVWTEFDAGASLGGMSARPYAGMKEFKGTDVLLPEGYDALLANLTEDIDLKLSEVVEVIDCRADGVRVQTANDRYEADFCVCTLPIGVLKARAVRFLPKLPTGLSEAIDRIGSGAVNKVVLKFDHVFWDDVPGIYYAKGSGRWPLYLNANKIRPGTPVLVNYTTGEYALEGEAKSDAALASEMMEPLRRIYGADIPDPVDVLVSRWQSDPCARGSYSFATPASRKRHFRQFESVVESRLAFAGEHTDHKYRATVHGAYLSGSRAVEALCGAKLGPEI